jgi:hypothetical protein
MFIIGIKQTIAARAHNHKGTLKGSHPLYSSISNLDRKLLSNRKQTTPIINQIII